MLKLAQDKGGKAPVLSTAAAEENGKKASKLILKKENMYLL